jgi:uncharacterized protein
MTSFIRAIVFFLLTFFALPTLALDLQSARDGGIVGEKTDGYIAVVTPSPAAEALAQSVNAKRKEEYARISAQNGQPVDVVAQLASNQIIQGLKSGSLYEDASGNWKKR